MTVNTGTTTAVQASASSVGILQTLAGVFTFFVICPYLSPIPLGTDTQPYALITALIFIATSIAVRGKAMHTTRNLNLLVFVAVYSAVISIILESVDIRSIGGYASLFIVGWASYLVFRLDLFSAKLFERVILLWFFVGAVQVTVWRGFGTQVLSRATTTDLRGVVGLAPEPSYHGITAVFFFMMLEILKGRKIIDAKRATFFQVLTLIQLALFAQSSIAILMMLIYYVVLCISQRHWKQLIALIVLTVAGALILTSGLFQSRIANLVVLVMRNPAIVSATDASVGDRVGSIWLCIYGFIKDFPGSIVGHGTSSWTDFVYINTSRFPEVCSTVSAGRILSGFGSAIFELGVVGLIIPYVLNRSLFAYRSPIFNAIGIFVTISMFAAIPLAFPLYSFLFGCSEALRGRVLDADPAPATNGG